MNPTHDKQDRNQHPNPVPVDLQIVGGGLAGLIAANLALDAGLSVRMIEAQRSTGGRASSTDRDGFTLNQGPHALYVGGELRTTLRSLGIDPAGAAPSIKGATGSIGSTVGLLPSGPTTLLRTSLLSARGKRHLLKFMVRLPKLDTAPLDSTTVAQWLDDTTDVPELKELLSGLINLSTYSFAPDMLSAGAALAQLQMALDTNVLYLDGGWATIVEGLESRLAAHRAVAQGRFERLQAKVTAIDADPDPSPESGPRGYACHSGGAVYRAATVLVAAGSPAVADRLLGGAGLVEAAGPPVEAAVLDLGLRTDPGVSIHLGLDTGLYFSTHSVAGGLAPAGQTLASAARYLQPGGDNSKPTDDRSADSNRALLLAHAAAAGVAPDDIVMERYLHRLTVAYGMPLAARGGTAGRPPVAVSGRPGLFIAGDWVGPTGLLADASAASAGAAIEAIARLVPPASGAAARSETSSEISSEMSTETRSGARAAATIPASADSSKQPIAARP